MLMTRTLYTVHEREREWFGVFGARIDHPIWADPMCQCVAFAGSCLLHIKPSSCSAERDPLSERSPVCAAQILHLQCVPMSNADIGTMAK